MPLKNANADQKVTKDVHSVVLHGENVAKV